MKGRSRSSSSLVTLGHRANQEYSLAPSESVSMSSQLSPRRLNLDNRRSSGASTEYMEFGDSKGYDDNLSSSANLEKIRKQRVGMLQLRSASKSNSQVDK